MDVLDAIGNTSLVRLRRIVPPDCADILVKLEWENPTGSMKDRMADAVISRAEADGRLKRGGTVVEYTGGSTGASLALVCAAKGYRIRIVTSDAFSQEKRDQMAALGAELVLVPSEGGMTTKKLILEMIATARGLAEEPGTFWVDQLHNTDTIAGYHALAEEIWSQTEGGVDAFVHCVGTAASSRGVAIVLRAHSAGVRIELRHRTGSRALESDSYRRSGNRLSTTKSSPSTPPSRRRWPGGSRARKGSSPGRRREPTSSRRSASDGSSAAAPRSSR
jgi:cysteine synthase A